MDLRQSLPQFCSNLINFAQKGLARGCGCIPSSYSTATAHVRVLYLVLLTVKIQFQHWRLQKCDLVTYRQAVSNTLQM